MSDSPSRRTVVLNGNLLREQRLQAGFTRESLAKSSRGSDAVSVATIKRAESGKPVYAGSAMALVRLLGVAPERLFAAPDPRQAAARTTLAVMPFGCVGGDEQQRSFVDGFVEEVINRLSSRWYPVISRSSTFSWQASGDQPPNAALLLGADYVVRGSVRIEATQYRISTQLLRSETSEVLWGDTFTVPFAAVFAARNSVVAHVIAALEGRLLEVEVERAALCASDQLDAWHCALRGIWHFYRYTAEDMQRARGLISYGLGLNPHLHFARYVLTLSYLHELVNEWTQDRAATVRDMRAACVEFERTSPGNGWMYVATAHLAVMAGDAREASDRLLEALEADANLVSAHSLYGQVLTLTGQYAAGLHELDLALSLSPRDPWTWAVQVRISLAHFAGGDYAAAAEWARRAIASRPHQSITYAALAAALVHRGELDAARAIATKQRQHCGAFASRGVMTVLAAADPEITKRVLDSLRLAGMSD